MPSKPSNAVKITPDKAVGAKEKPRMNAITMFSAVILAIIVVTFIGAPVVSQIAGASKITFGYYDGIPIEYLPGNYFAQQVEQLSRYYEQFKNTNVDLERQLVWRQAFEQAAQRIALKDLAQKAGILVTDNAIDKALVDFPNFQKDGHFSTELYRATAADDMMRYRKDTETQLLIQEYAGDRVSGAMIADADTPFIQKMAYPQRKFSFVVFNDADFPDSQVAAYALKNKDLFRSINLSRITVASESDAQRIHDEAVQGTKSFGDLAKEYSKDSLAESGGALNTKLYHDLQGEFSSKADLDKVFALKKGEISPIFHKDQQWAVYKVEAASADADLTAASTLSDVRAYIKSNDRGILEDYLMNVAKTFQASAQGRFDAAAKTAGKAVETTDYLALNFDNLSLFPSVASASKDPVFQGLAANETFFQKAFLLAKGAVSEPILASPSVLVVRVDDVRDAQPVPDAKSPTRSTPEITSDQILQMARQDRSRAFQQDLLNTPLFKDDFSATLSHLR